MVEIHYHLNNSSVSKSLLNAFARLAVYYMTSVSKCGTCMLFQPLWKKYWAMLMATRQQTVRIFYSKWCILKVYMFGRVRHFNNTGEYSCHIALIRLTFLFLECNEIPLVGQDTITSSSFSKSSFCTTKSSDSALTTIKLSSAILTEEPVEFRATERNAW